MINKGVFDELKTQIESNQSGEINKVELTKAENIKRKPSKHSWSWPSVSFFGKSWCGGGKKKGSNEVVQSRKPK